MTISSMTAVRTIIGQAQRRPWGMDARICSPAGPASRRAYGSWNKASGRSLSIAAVHCDPTGGIGNAGNGTGAGATHARQNLTRVTIFRPPEAVAQLVEQRTFNP